MAYLLDSWNVAALSNEVGDKPLGRTLLEIPVMLYRRQDGAAVAMSNLCPHRFAPLDRGTRKGDGVICKYHGLEFGADGRCIHNPHSDKISPKMHLRSFPVVERYGMIWFWPGDPEKADEALVPDMAQFTPSGGRRLLIQYLYTNYRYDILIDNLMDLSHGDYLHEGSFSGGAPERSELDVREDGDEVILTRRLFGTPPNPLFHIEQRTDMVDVIHWHPGQVITFSTRLSLPGADTALVDFEFFHLCTPQDADHTHYFTGALSRTADPAEDEAQMLFQRRVLEEEDGPMLDAIHGLMQGRELMDMDPVLLPTDAGAMRVRRVMKRLLARQDGAREAVAA